MRNIVAEVTTERGVCSTCALEPAAVVLGYVQKIFVL
jgi:hypothetical protein